MRGTPNCRVGSAIALSPHLASPAYLFVLEAKQQHLLHHGQLGLLAPLSGLANVSRVKRNLVAVLAALVARLWAVVSNISGRIGSRDAIAALALGGGSTTRAACAATPRQPR